MKVTFDPQGIAEQMEVCEATTPGPWFNFYNWAITNKADGTFTSLIGTVKANTADFIALSRTAYPAALTEILRLQAEAAALREQVARLQAEWNAANPQEVKA